MTRKAKPVTVEVKDGKVLVDVVSGPVSVYRPRFPASQFPAFAFWPVFWYYVDS